MVLEVRRKRSGPAESGRSRRYGAVFGASVVVHAALLTAVILLVPDVKPWAGKPPEVASSLRPRPVSAEEPPPPEPEEIPDEAEPERETLERMVSELDEAPPAAAATEPLPPPPVITLPARGTLTTRIGPRRRSPEPPAASDSAPGPSVSPAPPEPVVRKPVKTKARLRARSRPNFGTARGEVLLHVEVLADGSVGAVTVVEAKGSRRVEHVAVVWAKGVRFDPATVDGRPVRSTVKLRVKPPEG